jgi:hypothetical protein
VTGNKRGSSGHIPEKKKNKLNNRKVTTKNEKRGKYLLFLTTGSQLKIENEHGKNHGIKIDKPATINDGLYQGFLLIIHHRLVESEMKV